MGVRSIGCALGEVLYEIENTGNPELLRRHPGQSVSVLGDAGEAASAEFEKGTALCESPIERELLAALVVADWRPFGIETPAVWNLNDKSAVRPACKAIIVPQLRIGNRRLDFAISVPKHPIGTIIAVECDGADFHNTVEDRERDIQLGYFGVITLRFSGSEIKKDPHHCAARVVQACAEWANT